MKTAFKVAYYDYPSMDTWTEDKQGVVVGNCGVHKDGDLWHVDLMPINGNPVFTTGFRYTRKKTAVAVAEKISELPLPSVHEHALIVPFDENTQKFAQGVQDIIREFANK